jgi:MFS family permease
MNSGGIAASPQEPFSFGFLVSAIVTPCVGWLTDRRGPRLVIETGVVLMGTGLLLATLIREPWQLYLTLGALVGGGVNLLAYTSQSLYLTNWLRSSGRSRALGCRGFARFDRRLFARFLALDWL